MKPTTTSALLGAAITLAIAILVIPLLPHDSKAEDSSGGEQYKVVSIQTFESSQQLEQELNRLAAGGWKVRTGVGASVVMAR
jgi:hypothetical protein